MIKAKLPGVLISAKLVDLIEKRLFQNRDNLFASPEIAI